MAKGRCSRQSAAGCNAGPTSRSLERSVSSANRPLRSASAASLPSANSALSVSPEASRAASDASRSSSPATALRSSTKSPIPTPPRLPPAGGENLPLGAFSPPAGGKRGGVGIGDFVLDLSAVAGLLEREASDAARLASGETLNALFAEGNEAADALRKGLFALLTDRSSEREVGPALHPAADCRLHLPFAIGDYTDFYTGIHHAQNVGRQFRPDSPLLPNYKYVPIGYHGRASSIRPSGGDVRRPQGQRKSPDSDTPVFGPSQRLDYELEMAIWTSGSNALGSDIKIAQAADHIAGLSMLNDWSARDLQAWEYQPLGPFLAKNFLTTISPWIVTAEALA